MKDAKIIHLQSTHPKKILNCMCGDDVSQTYCDDHFTLYTYIESLCCTFKTNIMLYGNYIKK